MQRRHGRCTFCLTPCRFNEGGADDIGNGERLDTGHFPKPDLLAARPTCRIDAGIIVDDFLQRRDLEDIGGTRSAADIGLARLVNIVRRMRFDLLRGPPYGCAER
jgi:hypothetical protein